METAALIIVLGALASIFWLTRRAPRAAREMAAPPILATPPTLDAQIRAAADKWGLNPALLKGIARKESALGRVREGASGELGLMQIHPVNFPRRPLASLEQWKSDDRLSLDVASELLDEARRRFGPSPDHMLAAYNWGPAKVTALLARGGTVPRDLPATVASYVRDVRSFTASFLATDFKEFIGRQLA